MLLVRQEGLMAIWAGVLDENLVCLITDPYCQKIYIHMHCSDWQSEQDTVWMLFGSCSDDLNPNRMLLG